MRSLARLMLVMLVSFGFIIQELCARDKILIGEAASEMEVYAARELQRYVYQLSGEWWPVEPAPAQPPLGRAFVVGRAASHPLIQKHLLAEGATPRQAPLGPQAYHLKKLVLGPAELLLIAGGDDAGCLYGVYGLLEDHFDIRFYLGGDVLPGKKSRLKLPALDERQAPAVAIRGFLPWMNFPQSATSYSWDDWRFILDQMARLRLNFLHLHNYNGESGHNEMFHNFTLNGFSSRVWLATARSGHAWGGRPGWDPNRYRFGAGDLFDDYDFGADCALHNEHLTHEQIFRKGVSLFQKILAYAHRRGVKVGLGLDLNLIPPEYQAPPDDPRVIAARVNQVATDYPNLDYLLCFQNETIKDLKDGRQTWRKIFDGFYQGLQERAPQIRLAVAGWGITNTDVTPLPPEVICAPIAEYSDGCESGTLYGPREYWGCPWLERDFNSSEYYYPYNLHLTNTLKAWQQRAPNMKGFYCLTWRLTDAIEPKLWFISKAPWDAAGRLNSAAAVYADYAQHHYGARAAAAIAPILNQNEPYASNFGECEQTPGFFPGGTSGYLLNLAAFKLLGTNAADARTYSAAHYSAQQGVRKAPCDEAGECVGWIERGDWIRFDQLDFGEGATRFEARVASSRLGGLIELRLGSPTGPWLGVCQVTNTGGWQKWATVRAPLIPTSGRQDLCLHFLTARPPTNDYAKATVQLAVMDRCLAEAETPAQRERLRLLRCRLAAARDHIELNEYFELLPWDKMPSPLESWVPNFVNRVTDISSLGNVVSVQNRFIQRTFLGREQQLRQSFLVQPPANVVARGTRAGAFITWQNQQTNPLGFNLYCAGRKLNRLPLPPDTVSFAHGFHEEACYTVTALDASGQESPPSLPARCQAGAADNTPPRLVVISPPTSAAPGQVVWLKARCLDNRVWENLSATLYYRGGGARPWRSLPMTRRVKAIFTAVLPPPALTTNGLEYYFESSDGDNRSVYPPGAPRQTLFLTVANTAQQGAPAAPLGLAANGLTLTWLPSPAGAFWYRIYRGRTPDFTPGPDTFLTYVEGQTTAFRDNGLDLMSQPLRGKWYYRIRAVSFDDGESLATEAAGVDYPNNGD